MKLKISQKNTYIFIIFIIYFGISILCHKMYYASAVSFAGLLFFCFYIFLEQPIFLVKYLYIFFTVFSEVIGCLVIEYNTIYLNEIDSYSYYVGALPTLIFAQWIFLFIIYVYDKKLSSLNKKEVGNSYLYTRWMQVLCIIIGFFCILIFIRIFPFPSFILGLDRFDYGKAGYIYGVWNKIANAVQYVIIIPILAVVGEKKRLGFIALLPYVLYLIWTGNKFGIFFNLFYIFLLCYYDKLLTLNKSKVKSLLMRLCLFIGMLIGFSLVAITFTLDTPVNKYFYNRIAQQGELWWKTYELCGNQTHPEEFINEIQALFNSKEAIADNVGANYGIYNIMYFTSPEQKINYKLMSGSRYTCAGYANIYYYFGYAGIIIHSLLFAIVSVATVNGIIFSLRKEQYIKSTILYRLFVVERSAFSMYLFKDLFDILSIVSYIYLIVVRGNKKFITGEKKKSSKCKSLILQSEENI